MGSTRDYTLFYANRFLKDASFHEEFIELSRSLPHFRYVTVRKSEDPAGPENDGDILLARY